jgi:hypothetical protein
MAGTFAREKVRTDFFRDIRSRLIQNVRYRTMTAKGKTFVWAPDGGSICVGV